MSKEVILQIDNVRIIRYNSMNLEIQRLETTYNPFEKEYADAWRFKGYSSTVLKSLQSIQRKELLIDENSIQDLKSVLNQIEESNQMLLRAVDEVKQNEFTSKTS